MPEEGPKTECSFQFFGQLQPNDVPQPLLDELEHEMEEPEGISTVRPQEMKLRGVLVSPNCAMLYELPDITGMKWVIDFLMLTLWLTNIYLQVTDVI